MSPSRAALLLSCLALAGFATASSRSPVSVWGSSSAFLSSAAEPKALPSVQALDELFGAVDGLADNSLASLKGLLSVEALAEQRPTAVVVFASGAEQRSPAVEAKLAELSAAAASSLQLPNAVHDESGARPVFEAYRRSAKQLRMRLLGDCGVGMVRGLQPATAQALQEVLEGSAADASAPPLLVVVCPPAGDDAGEAELLGAAQALLSSLAPRHMMAHVKHPPSAVERAEQRRRLAAADGGSGSIKGSSGAERTNNYTTCDPTCRKHVMWFEGLIVFIVILIALLVGCSCMHMVDVPSRFAQPQQASRQHQD